ncbi:hypothetical protein [Variovorax boronicumulans]|uniref:hypothetical protein n=1 Tax=Variovorax boronicumulans TaxID=436515 RepID=UPI001C568AD6
MNSRPLSTGDGTRPTTDGGADNIGGGESFTGHKNKSGEDIAGPAPQERMQDRKKDAHATKQDDSAPLGLNEDLTPVPNREPSED